MLALLDDTYKLWEEHNSRPNRWRFVQKCHFSPVCFVETWFGFFYIEFCLSRSKAMGLFWGEYQSSRVFLCRYFFSLIQISWDTIIERFMIGALIWLLFKLGLCEWICYLCDFVYIIVDDNYETIKATAKWECHDFIKRHEPQLDSQSKRIA